MIDALIGGKLHGKPTERVGASGKAFVAAKLRAADSDGEGLFISVVAFSDSAKAGLLALDDGDSCALAGTLKIGTYTARDGAVKVSVSVVADAVLSAYHVRRKRESVAQASAPKPKPEPRGRATAAKKQGLHEADALFGDTALTQDRLDDL